MRSTLFLIASSLLLAAPLADANDKPTRTSMNEITQLYQIKTCKNKLEQMALDLVGSKNHRIHVLSAKGDDHLFDAFMYLQFNDRPAHVQFAARAGKDGSCEASYTMTFTIGDNCVAARAETLGKFEQLGTLGNETYVYGNNKRKPHVTAIASPIDHDRACLITYKFNDH